MRSVLPADLTDVINYFHFIYLHLLCFTTVLRFSFESPFYITTFISLATEWWGIKLQNLIVALLYHYSIPHFTTELSHGY